MRGSAGSQGFLRRSSLSTHGAHPGGSVVGQVRVRLSTLGAHPRSPFHPFCSWSPWWPSILEGTSCREIKAWSPCDDGISRLLLRLQGENLYEVFFLLILKDKQNSLVHPEDCTLLWKRKKRFCLRCETVSLSKWNVKISASVLEAGVQVWRPRRLHLDGQQMQRRRGQVSSISIW